jgi:hypothetical protein
MSTRLGYILAGTIYIVLLTITLVAAGFFS